jgi:hypothetical protein
MLTQRPISLRNRACSSVPRRQVTLLGLFIHFLVSLDKQFNRVQNQLHPPGRWP